jgi:AraC-like DNA-binding protein
MARVSTGGLRPAGKAQGWSEQYSRVLAAADFIPYEDNFSAGLMMSHVGPLEVARLATGRCAIRRTAAHIDGSSPKLYSILLQANGRGMLTQVGNRVVLSPGDLALCDHALPHSRVLEKGAEVLIIRVPAELIADYLPQPQHLCGRRLPGGTGLASSAANMTRELWRRLEEGFTSPYGDCLAHHLLELIATSYAMAFGDAGADAETVLLVRNHIEDRLHDPEFRSGALASELGMSLREVRQVFAERDASPRQYLHRRRLEEAARRLRDPRWRGHTIAEIAHCCGFASNAMFARSFRERYDLSPTEYRAKRPPARTEPVRPSSISFALPRETASQ